MKLHISSVRNSSWGEFLSSYDFDISYHEGKGNVVADALSRQRISCSFLMLKEFEQLQEISCFNLSRDSGSSTVHLCSLVVAPSLITRVIKSQNRDPKLASALDLLLDDTLDQCPSEWSVGSDGGLQFRGRLCVPDDPDIWREILQESHRSRFAIHPGGVKMYHDLKRTFWWEGMKRDVSVFVAHCMTCQQVKAEHQ